MIRTCMPIYKYHYQKLALCRGRQGLPSAIKALGKQVLSRVLCENTQQNKNTQQIRFQPSVFLALGKLAFECFFSTRQAQLFAECFLALGKQDLYRVFFYTWQTRSLQSVFLHATKNIFSLVRFKLFPLHIQHMNCTQQKIFSLSCASNFFYSTYNI